MNEVVLYTLSTCPWCGKSKRFFQDREIPFTCTDYDLADEASQERIFRVMDRHRASAFPFAMINGDAVEGYDPARYSSLLGISG